METFNPTTSARTYRDALGCFATGVTVVTCASAKGPLAMTANSFASVSLDPPLVLWSPGKNSSRYPAFMTAQHFAIHVLRNDQAALATRFAKDGTAFDGTAWTMDTNGTPHLTDCLSRFDCLTHAQHDAGDHTIIVGLVQNAAHSIGQPLVFAQGAYGFFTNGS
ncbi:flavin reductase family protein [Actibacterium sp. 188UL27-1]|uniref:flavin reductase family protein n=1 Tax=Actibacterium sp. 188UL27-1 TaxID=2786961 RepID=UPI00195C42CC|nr:flavin reductase family protein [Actibacterium sp. 188UL27-1]MBM7068435.1 flavin reductase family protein [Actibacterium sp. 188UL27-1]